MTHKRPPDAWMIFHEWNGELNKCVKLSRADADEYAAKHHGIIYPLYMNYAEEYEPKVHKKVE